MSDIHILNYTLEQHLADDYNSGKATVIALASRGAKVYMGARSELKAKEAIDNIQKELPNADILFIYMDLTKLETVVAAAKLLRR